MLWKTYDDKSEENLIEELMEECGLTHLQAKLLINRNINTIDKANHYLYGNYLDFYDPSSLKDIDKAVDILIYAKENNLEIYIAGDYDADGIDGTAVTYLGLKYAGIKSYCHIPHRIKEGFGLSMIAIDEILEKKYKIVYTVDNGIAAYNEVKRLKENNISVIVSDHHDIPKTEKGDYFIPPADAIVNPKQIDCNYPNKNLCGCSVSWKILFHLYNRLGLDTKYLYNLLPLVAVATVGDLMPLVDENRLIVKEGLKLINNNKNYGISLLKEIYDIKELKSSDLSFKIVPTINADGRLKDAYSALKLVISENINDLNFITKKLFNSDKLDSHIEEKIRKKSMELFPELKKDCSLDIIFEKSKKLLYSKKEELKDIANQLYKTNEKRKDLTKQFMDECISIIENNFLNDKNVIVILHPNIPEGLVGLVAGRLKEKYHKPSFVFSYGEEYIKGSCRGVDGHPLLINDAIEYTRGLWEKGGGHSMAGGLSFKKDENLINEFRDKLDKYAEKLLKESNFEPFMYLDGIENTPTEELCKEIDILQPTGNGNKDAVFGTDLLNIKNAKPVGNGTHIRFELTNNCNAIGFNLTSLYNDLNHPNKLKFAYTPNINIYNPPNSSKVYKNIQMQLIDFKTNEDTFSNKQMLISSIKQISRKKY